MQIFLLLMKNIIIRLIAVLGYFKVFYAWLHNQSFLLLQVNGWITIRNENTLVLARKYLWLTIRIWNYVFVDYQSSK